VSELTLPGNANTTAGAQNASLNSVDCPSAGSCAATGSYKDTTGSVHAMVATQSAGGSWQASALTLPANANSTAGHQSAALGSVVCTSAGNCAAAGSYKDTAGSFQALIATQSSGGPWQASELTLPANANSTAGAQNAFLNSMVCTSVGTCAAAGSYKDTTGSFQALVVSSVAPLAVGTSSLPSGTARPTARSFHPQAGPAAARGRSAQGHCPPGSA
jgi:hypothetical protein